MERNGLHRWITVFWIAATMILLSVPVTSQKKAVPAWPAPPGKAKIRFVRSISVSTKLEEGRGFFNALVGFLFGDRMTSHWLIQPVGIAIDREGRMFVADPGAHGIHRIDPEENEYKFISDSHSGKFRSPVGCAVSDDGEVFVTDSESGTITVLDSDGDPEREIRGDLKRPTGIRISRGRIYVTDTGVHGVVVMDLEGNVLRRFGSRGTGAGEFNFPIHLAVDDSIRVVDALNYRIQTFDTVGTFGSTFGTIGNVGGSFASPKNIAQDSDGNIYVSDALMDNVQIFNNMGQLLLVFGKHGSGDGEFLTPNGIAIDHMDRVYVVDSVNRRIQIFQYTR